jgi:hypothetical protein
MKTRNWYGITYPLGFLVTGNNCWFLRFWKKHMCPHGWHIFDECDNGTEHTLYCDACDLDIVIKEVYKWNHETNINDYLGE